jgi:hypothetical protein
VGLVGKCGKGLQAEPTVSLKSFPGAGVLEEKTVTVVGFGKIAANYRNYVSAQKKAARQGPLKASWPSSPRC